MKLTIDQVRHVASLARLSLTPEEEVAYSEKLSAILDAVEQLRALDTENVEPTSHATVLESVLRPDQVQTWKGAEAAVKGAPAQVGTSFAVPKILE